MISSNYVPEKTSEYNAYPGGSKMIGVATSVTLPEISMKTSTVSGVGVNGELDSPTVRQSESMEQETQSNILYNSAMDMLSPPPTVNLIPRAAQQVYDKTGGYSFKGPRVMEIGRAKSFNPGKVEKSETMEVTTTPELTCTMIEVDGVQLLEVGKLNGICKVNGNDMLAGASSLVQPGKRNMVPRLTGGLCLSKRTTAERSITTEEIKNAMVEVNAEMQEINTEREGVSEECVVKLTKPYVFEGKEYEEIDLLGLEKLTTRDAIDTQLEPFDVEVTAFASCETTAASAKTMIVKATGLFIEFFKLMPRGAFRRVAGVVHRHMNAGDEAKNHVVQLGKPHNYKGKEYRETDLNGVADLDTPNESEAENRMAREGSAATENGTNYLYACVIVPMATGIPEDFLTSLPLYELLKPKNAVNDADLFEQRAGQKPCGKR